MFLRHSRMCNFYRKFNRCKFGSFCSYLHLKTAVSTSTKDELDNVNERVTLLEKLLVKKVEQIMVLKSKVNYIGEEYTNIKPERENTRNIIEEGIRKTTESMTTHLNARQDEKETDILKKFDFITQQLELLLKGIKSTIIKASRHHVSEVANNSRCSRAV